ncbi:MAG: nucleoside hydrolase, partial [Deltaproteobacteria bacterium]|nr:nucleoside hydrolase [Deltaproteobacteria bacterium]
TTGPLNNLADWMENCPETVKRLREIISMGGVFFQAGNRSQAAEFNIHANPAAARRVVEFCRAPTSSGIYEWRETLPLTFVGLDVTHQVRFRREILNELLNSGGRSEHLSFIRDITRFYMDFYYRNEGLDGCYLHDPLAVAYVVDPTLCQAEQYIVEVEDRGDFTKGMTVADYRPTRLFKDKMKEVTWVCYKVQSRRFEEMFVDRVLKV